jgi:Tfp pilus assembly protein PilX
VRTTSGRTAAWARQDDGASLVTVVSAFALLFALVLTTSLYVVRSIRQTATFTDSELALSAAESGIADYLARASADPGYWSETDCTNVALQVPVTVGETSDCEDWISTPAIGWAAVEQDADAETSPAFHYTVLGWDTQNGTEATWLTLQVTGRSGEQYRTLQVTATRESTEQYTGYQNHWARVDHTCTDSSGARVYQWTAGMYPTNATMPSVRCLRTLGSANGSNNGWRNGTELTIPSNVYVHGDWQTNSWVNPVEGDFFSNDIGFVSPGPASMNATYTVNGTLTLVNPWCTGSAFGAGWQSDVIATDCGAFPVPSPAFNPPFLTVSRVTVSEEPQLSSSRTLPYDTSALSAAPGCRYYGPTRVVLHDDGTMTVWSKQSGYDALTLSVPARGSTDAVDCGSAADLVADAGATVPVPDGMVVHVADLPSEVATANGVVNGRLDGKEIGGNEEYGYLPAGDVAADVLAQAMAEGRTGNNEILLDTSTYPSSRYRTEGNLWVEGELRGSVTLATDGAVLVTGDLVTAGGTDAGDDQLGIVASDVKVVDQRLAYHLTQKYIDTDGASATSGTRGDWPHSYDGNTDEVRIEAAIQVLASGLGYQDQEYCILTSGHPGYEGWMTGGAEQYYFDFPYVTVDRSTTTPSAHLPELTQGEATVDVVVDGALAQNYLSFTGIRRENAHVTGYSGSVNVYYEAGSCGMDVRVEYDDRLQTSTPPYLLRFTDVGWERGDSSEVSTPEQLRG